MRKLFCLFAAGIICLGLSALAYADSQTPVNIGIRGGLGMDLSGGLAYGLGGNYAIDLGGSAAELGLHLYGGSYSEDSTNGIHTYTEKTNLFVFSFLANYLINYSTANPGLFFVSGAGLAGVNVEWTESSPTDTSLGTLLPGGGSSQSVDAFAAGSVINLGIGYLFESGLDMRLETPMIFIFGGPGKSASFVPAITLTGGYRF